MLILGAWVNPVPGGMKLLLNQYQVNQFYA